VSLEAIWLLSSYLCPGRTTGPFPFSFLTENIFCISHLFPYMVHAPSSSFLLSQ
jgi:hypothetical protein